MDYTDQSEPPILYRKWVAISVIAAALQRKCYLGWGSLTFYPNMYIVLVGPSGKCRKGTAMGVGAGFLRDLGVSMAAEAVTREALIRELNEASQTDPDFSSGEINTHASLTIYSPELTVFLGYNNMRLMIDLTDWYDCRDRWKYVTKNMGTDDITGVWVNMIGATTPGLIQSALPRDAIGGGLSSRMIFITEQEKGKVVATPWGEGNTEELRESLMHDLSDIHSMSGKFQVTKDFIKEKWVPWYYEQEDNPPFKGDPNFAGYIHRRPNHILKLCMILSASEGSDMIITADIFDRALNLLEQTEINMPMTFRGVGSSRTSEVMARIMSYIAAEGETSYENLLSQFKYDVDGARQLEDFVQTFKKMGFCNTKANARGEMTITFNKNFEENVR